MCRAQPAVSFAAAEGLAKGQGMPCSSRNNAAGACARLALLPTQWQQAQHVQSGARQGLACTQDWLWRWLIQNWRQGAWGTILSCFFRILWVPCRAQEPV